jgi:alkanesulfonate monooxygenase SsuD/methylene tetrahydromethanopterin reductase-like flavin-dependent oxidoreductase (luciferase family)
MTKFGLQIPNFTFADVPDREMFEHVADLAVAGEQAGFDSVWVMDHFWQLPPLGGPTQPMLEAYTLLGGLAARTRRVKLGTLVTGVTYRNPALLAKMVTTLDIVSSGRAMLGLGAAWYEEEHDAFGFDFPSAGKRLDRLEEALQICRAMFTEEAPSFAGKRYRARSRRTGRASWSAAAVRSARCGSSRSTPTCATSTGAPTPFVICSKCCAATAPMSAATRARSRRRASGRCS